MARVFENPANGYQETVGSGDSWAVFFLGAIYLAIKGLWNHVFIWLAIVLPLTIASGGVGIVLLVPIACIIYALSIQDTLAKSYLKKGWKEVAPGGMWKTEYPPVEMPTAMPDLITDTFMSKAVKQAEPSKPTTKQCPFCAEEVKYEAIKCKHCQSDLPVS